MSTVAEQLREGREAKSFTVHQVAEITKIRTDHLRALEEGNYEVFTAPVYIRGFVRTYSTLLKLDVGRVMQDLDEELGRTERFAEPPSLSPQPHGLLDILTLQLSKVDWRKGLIGLGVIVVLLVLVLGYLAYHRYRTTDPLRGLPPGIYKKSGSPGETLPPPTSSQHR